MSEWAAEVTVDAALDLVLYWSTLPPEGRSEFLDAYGPVSDGELLRARVLSLFLCGTLAVYGRHEGLPALEREAIDSLERTVRSR